jgi:hypothetical protein
MFFCIIIHTNIIYLGCSLYTSNTEVETHQSTERQTYILDMSYKRWRTKCTCHVWYIKQNWRCVKIHLLSCLDHMETGPCFLLLSSNQMMYFGSIRVQKADCILYFSGSLLGIWQWVAIHPYHPQWQSARFSLCVSISR